MSNAPVRPTISIDILNQVDIRVGTIEAVDDVEGSDKLVKMRVNFGGFTRTLFVVNLEPRKMRGVVSEGMLFDIGFADGIRPVLAVPEERVPDGSRAG